jgi:hypothetical protein
MKAEQYASDPSDLVWVKSSYSTDTGGNCVEVAVERRKSSHSDSEGAQCLEVAACPGIVHVRDSKDRTGPTLAFAPDEWADFVRFALAGRSEQPAHWRPSPPATKSRGQGLSS